MDGLQPRAGLNAAIVVTVTFRKCLEENTINIINKKLLFTDSKIG